ncbi:hypothetical protein H4S08_000862 [Coemansia sp. RSA 1365]|nr:hypothetical protein H4S08_000862 [Coemansia sp. RSA 1365]
MLCQPLLSRSRQSLVAGRIQIPRLLPTLPYCTTTGLLRPIAHSDKHRCADFAYRRHCQPKKTIQKRCVSVRPLYAERDDQLAGSVLPRHDKVSQLRDLAADMARDLHAAESPTLNRWAHRIDSIVAQRQPSRRTGILYMDGMETQARLITTTAMKLLHKENDTGGVYYLDSSIVDSDMEMFADWLFSCESVVLVADRIGVLKTLIHLPAFRLAITMHSRVHLVVDGMDANSATADIFADLLRESLVIAGVSTLPPVKLLHWVISLAAIHDSPKTTASQARVALESAYGGMNNTESNRMDLLACSLGAAISSASTGGTRVFAFTQINDAMSTQQSKAAMQTLHIANEFVDAADSTDSGHLSSPSKSIQSEFENGDLKTVDTSIGVIKQRIRQWFASGEIWLATLMRVYEVSDNLIDNAILDRMFEDADLGMVHATGRLNESISRITSELAKEIEALGSTEHAGTTIVGATADSGAPAFVSAAAALRALAAQKASIETFALARHVWAARKQLLQEGIQDSIPRYIHWSLAQFWSIHAAALACSATSVLYFGIPLHYATAGGLGLGVFAFVWLGHRWNQLRLGLDQTIDRQGASLRAELAEAHRTALQTRLDLPIAGCVKDITALQHSPLGDTRQYKSGMYSDETISTWKSRLASALS